MSFTFHEANKVNHKLSVRIKKYCLEIIVDLCRIYDLHKQLANNHSTQHIKVHRILRIYTIVTNNYCF